jgi:hypothetical protein
MGEPIKSASKSGSIVADAAAVVVFVVSILGWLFVWDIVAQILYEWTRYPKAGDAAIGMILFGPTILGASVWLLLASIILLMSVML